MKLLQFHIGSCGCKENSSFKQCFLSCALQRLILPQLCSRSLKYFLMNHSRWRYLTVKSGSGAWVKQLCHLNQNAGCGDNSNDWVYLCRLMMHPFFDYSFFEKTWRFTVPLWTKQLCVVQQVFCKVNNILQHTTKFNVLEWWRWYF